MTSYVPSDADAALFGNRFATAEVPSREFPDDGDVADDAMRLVGEDIALEGDPARNLATFVTTWMEPQAQRIIADNLHRNFIDHAEYPRTAEIEQRCIRMLADLFHAPGETTGARTQGSSEAIMLGGAVAEVELAHAAGGRQADRPAQPGLRRRRARRVGEVLPLLRRRAAHRAAQPGKYTIGPEDVAPHVDENTIGVAAVLGTTFTGHKDDIVGINDLLVRIKKERGLDVPLHVDGASGGFVWPFLYPDSPWDFRLEQVRSINVSGHKFGLVYPGIGWLIFRETSDLAPDLVFEENYLGKTDATFTLNFSTGSSMVLAQYYNLVRYGRDGYTYIMQNMLSRLASTSSSSASRSPSAMPARRWGPPSVCSDAAGPSSASSARKAADSRARSGRRGRDGCRFQSLEWLSIAHAPVEGSIASAQVRR